MKNSPWGTVQREEVIDSGICFVSTAGHGGYLVDKAKVEARIPEPVREALFVGRYKDLYAFEEDCDSVLFALYFPEYCSDRELEAASAAESMLKFTWKSKPAQVHIKDRIKVIRQRFLN